MNKIDLNIGYCGFAGTVTPQMLEFIMERMSELTAAEIVVLTLYQLTVVSKEPPSYQIFAMALQDLNEFLETNEDPKGSFDGHFAGWFDCPEVGSLDNSQISNGTRIEGRDAERLHLTWNVSGKVLEVSPGKKYVKMHLTGLSGDRDEAWILTPYEIPEWAFEGGIFRAQLSRDVETFEQLAIRPWALRDFPELASLPITDAELDELSQAWDELSVKQES